MRLRFSSRTSFAICFSSLAELARQEVVGGGPGGTRRLVAVRLRAIVYEAVAGARVQVELVVLAVLRQQVAQPVAVLLDGRVVLVAEQHAHRALHLRDDIPDERG